MVCVVAEYALTFVAVGAAFVIDWVAIALTRLRCVFAYANETSL
jgi:hypothetical protein